MTYEMLKSVFHNIDINKGYIYIFAENILHIFIQREEYDLMSAEH